MHVYTCTCSSTSIARAPPRLPLLRLHCPRPPPSAVHGSRREGEGFSRLQKVVPRFRPPPPPASSCHGSSSPCCEGSRGWCSPARLPLRVPPRVGEEFIRTGGGASLGLARSTHPKSGKFSCPKLGIDPLRSFLSLVAEGSTGPEESAKRAPISEAGAAPPPPLLPASPPPPPLAPLPSLPPAAVAVPSPQLVLPAE